MEGPEPDQPAIGKLVIGDVTVDIESVTFINGLMRVCCTMGPEHAGHLAGLAVIQGADGEVAWRGIRRHDLGVKTAGAGMQRSTWMIQFDADIVLDRSSVAISARYDPPEGVWPESYRA